MAAFSIRYKFGSEKGFSTCLAFPSELHSMSVYELKIKIVEKERLYAGKDFDLYFSDPNTHQVYSDEDVIQTCSSTVLRRVPWPSIPIVDKQSNTSSSLSDSIFTRLPEEVQVQNALPTNIADGNTNAKASIQDGFATDECYKRDLAGRMLARHGYDRCTILEPKKPPPGYICRRCKVPGHFIRHCPTNGDPDFDIKKLNPGSGVCVLKPDEVAFQKAIEGIPSNKRVISNIPPELLCPICKEMMKDAMIASKCCFRSFCDKCIRNYIVSKDLMCTCGATNVLTDDLLPNATLRKTIDFFLNPDISSEETSRTKSSSQGPLSDKEPARLLQIKVPSPTHSVTSKGEFVANPPPKLLKRARSTTSQGIDPVSKVQKKARLPTNDGLQFRASHDIAADKYVMPFIPSASNFYWGCNQFGLQAI